MHGQGIILLFTLLHSLWQSAILLAAFRITAARRDSCRPLERRDLLLGMLIIQLFLSVITFTLLSSGEGYQINGSHSFSTTFFPESITNGLLMFYWLIAGMKTARIFINKSRLLPTDIKSAPATIRSFTDWQAENFQIGRKVSVWVSSRILSPMTFGFLKPAIILPAALKNRLSPEETECIIIHELNHILNNDYLINYGLLAMEALYFFNPALLQMVRDIRLEREKDCDLRVLHFNYSPVLYAETLLKLSRFSKSQSRYGIPLLGAEGQLMKRIRFITRSDISQSERSLPKTIILTLLFPAMLWSILPVEKEKGPDALAEKIVQKRARVKDEKPLPFRMAATGNSNEALASARARKREKPNKKSEVSGILKKKEPVQAADIVQIAEYPVEDARFASFDTGEKTKFVLLEEESSGGKKITKCFRVRLRNNQWEMTLLWTLLTEPGNRTEDCQ